MNPVAPGLPSGSVAEPQSRILFARAGWLAVAYTVAVILFGAVVRITGSGAGCGQHWPTCQGEVVHLPKSTATAIELSHRVTSGVSLLVVVALCIAAFRLYPARHPTRRAAALGVAFMLTESLVGAALVLLRLVGQNTSLARAAVGGVHLANTSFLLGFMALTAWTATRPAVRVGRLGGPLEKGAMLSLVATLCVSITGAFTALGDTLYPVQTARTLAERIAADQSAAATLFERGRAIHPLVAFTAAVLVALLAWKIHEESPSPEVRRAALRVIAVVAVQVCAGVTNIWLSAPGYMQVIHLALATSLWVLQVLLLAETLWATRAAG